MISICALKGNGGDIHSYLAQADYYSENGNIKGYWFGEGSKQLGLAGEVKLEDFEKVLAGEHPETGQYLRPRQSKIKGRDLTISAPKSVSVLAGPGGDKRLDYAHLDAVQELLEHIQKEASCEVKAKGKSFDRKTNSLIAAVFTHDTSRELDPQIHSHIACANLTFDPKENRWKALDASKLYERKKMLTEIYRNALAKNVMKLGYQIETVSTGANGRDRSFEVVGVSKELREKFSKMSRNIEKEVKEYEQEKGEKASVKEARKIALDARPEKVHLSPEEVKSRHLSELSEKDKADLMATREKAKANEGRTLERGDVRTSVFHALDHCTDRKSVCKDYEIVAEALRHGRGLISVEGVQQTLKELKKQGMIFQFKNNVATRQSLNREKESVAIVDQGVSKFDRLDRSNEFVHAQNKDGSMTLNDSQRAAVNSILASRDFVTNLRGAAGVGKTHTLSEVYRGLKEAGHDVLALAPTKSAVQELKGVGIAEDKTFTVAKLLDDKLAGEKIKGKIILIDESGMLDSKQGFELLRLGHQNAARLIFSGDTKQLQSVSEGDFLRILEKESSLSKRTHELTEIIRQKDEKYRFAMELFRTNPKEAFELLDQLGCIREVKAKERTSAIANELKAKPGALVVGTTHLGNDSINAAISKSSGGEDRESFTRMHALSWTEAERKNVKNYEPGQYLIFHKPTANGKLDNAYCVTGVNGRFVETVNLEGEQVRFSQKQAKAFNVFAKKEFQAGVGDRVIFTANAKRDGFECVNGQQAHIASFDDKGRAMLNTGQTVPADFGHWNLGYAITVHKSQGKSCDHVISSADAMNWEQSYVAWSRAKETLTIFTTDKEALQKSITESGERISAMELAAEANASRNREHGSTSESADATAGAKCSTPTTSDYHNYQRVRKLKQAGQEVELAGSVYRYREEEGYHEIDHSYSAWSEMQLHHERERGRGGA